MAGRPPRGPDDRYLKPAAGYRSEQNTPQLSPIQSQPAMHPPHNTGHMSLSLPPLRQLSSTPPTPSSRRCDNPLGVQSILNPQAELIEQQRELRRNGYQMETPSPVDTHHSNSLPSISRPTSVDSTQDEQRSQRLFQPPGRPSARHMLTPKSPSLHRAQSLGGLNRPTGTIDAHQSPFLTATVRPSESTTTHPALPTPPAGSRTSYFPPLATSAPASNILITEGRRTSGQFLPSGSASPMTQYSPYSQAASLASGYEGHGPHGHYACAPEARTPGYPMGHERNMIPVAPSGQSSIQIMTIKSQQGHNVQIPVDVQAASKVADEKRKRNAGASARFRARRKEKEREASTTISKLEQQVRDAVDRAEFYRSERDFFRAIIHQQPGAERHYQRPTSPVLRRLSSVPSHTASPMNEGGSDESYGDYEDERCDTGRNVRRRTGSYQLGPGRSPLDTNMSPFSSHGYAPSHGPSSRNQRYAPDDEGQLPALQLPTMERPSYRDPFP
ncbi:uncharacterized protein M421DRAFT_414925 [Didymella exigua CBS 183.55]|uniref:BZIP domain-containing protein n=1 Tax=Didymella exigua CBS 183.55 TaxID=1150837 RepID=A0A6A5RZI2_9PLEO|nr:uncharacterized protein M421DRAFT_414925 [Didymella exigua CBS 183.55]KAF1933875.1 hypothetical protein M421DRAFT_414925 [Didymella exigua CBS 183.55]